MPNRRLLNASELLLGDDFAPMTSAIGFLASDLAAASAALSSWLSEVAGARFASRQETLPSLQAALEMLPPLTSVDIQRYLLVQAKGGWTAYFDNSHQGPDVFSRVSYLARLLSCRGVRIQAVPHTYRTQGGKTLGRYGALAFEVYGPGTALFERQVLLLNDGGRWRFDQGGTPFPFEQTARYAKAVPVRERFDLALLKAYAAALGLEPFDTAFYQPDGAVRCSLVEAKNLRTPGMRSFNLAEIRATF